MVSYKPTQPGEALKHPIRQGIIDLLAREPMSSKQSLRRSLGCSWGTIHHHIHILERAGLIQGVMTGPRARYFLPGTDVAEASTMHVLRNQRALDLLQRVVAQPGSVQRTLTEDLGMSRKMFRIYVDRLIETGLLREEIAGRCLEYHPTTITLQEKRTPQHPQTRPDPFLLLE